MNLNTSIRLNLQTRYEKAVIGKRRKDAHIHPVDLFHATGDPLVEQNYALAAQVYGLAGASRPAVQLRNIRARHFHDPRSSITDMAIWFQDRRPWSAQRSAGEAVALAGERGTWIGLRAPVSFERAVELTRKSMGQVRSLGSLRYIPEGWTGTHLYVVPVQGRLLTMPAPLPPRTRLPLEGAWVRNDAYWRRLLRDGDVQENPVT